MLSDRTIEAAIKKCQTEKVLNDGTNGHGTGSLVLVIRRKKTMVTSTWVGRWWIDGKQRKKTLGDYPRLSLAAARQAFTAQVSTVLQDGKNPRAMSVAADKPTVRALFDACCDQMEADGKTSAAEYRRVLRQVAAAWGDNKLAGSVDPSDVSHYLEAVFSRGARVAADRTRSYLSAAFNYGLKATHDYRSENRRDWGLKLNPVTAVAKDTNSSTPGKRALSAAELVTLWHGLDAGNFALETTAAIKLLICTGQRVRELLRMDTSEIDLDAMTWTMPVEKTKMKIASHTVFLPDQARPVLQALLAKRQAGLLMPTTDWVLGKAISRWCAASGFERFTPRDLRRTWKSRAHDAGVDRYTRDLVQQHERGDTGSIHYDLADYHPQMREAMRKWSVWLSATLEQPGGALDQRGALDAPAQAHVAA